MTVKSKFNKKDFAFNGWDLDDVLEEFEHVLEGDIMIVGQPTIHKLHVDLNTIGTETDQKSRGKRRRKCKANRFE